MSINYKPEMSVAATLLGGVIQGNVFFVHPYLGSDGNTGTDMDNPVKTILAAFNKTVSGNGDVVFLMSNTNTSSATTSYLSEKLTWDHDNTHLIGLGAKSLNPRARIAQLSTATAVDGLLTVSGSGCTFANFSLYQGVDDATSMNALTVTGQRNNFVDVHVKGLSHATMCATASSPVMTMTGAGENLFQHCTIGETTIQPTAAVFGLNMTADCMNNVFEDCLFVVSTAAAGYEFVHIANDGLLCYTLFKRCSFINAPDSAGGLTTITSAFTSGKNLADYDGQVVLQDCYLTNASQIGSGTAYTGAGHSSGTYGDAAAMFLCENPT